VVKKRSIVKTLALAAIFSGAFFLSSVTSEAKPEYSRKTEKDCAFCHPAGSFNLNEAGQYYRDHKYSLKGYVPSTPPPKSDPKQGKN
jgi:hypothetical protein